MNHYKTLFKILYVESLVSYIIIVTLSLPGMIIALGFYTILYVLLGFFWTLPIIFIIKTLFEYVPRYFILKSTRKQRNFNFRFYFSFSIMVSAMWILAALFINEMTVRQLQIPMFIGLLNMLSIYITVKLSNKYKFIEFLQEQS